MQIIHRLDDFFFTLFPEIGGGSNKLIVSRLTDFYQYGPFKPKVTIKDDLAIIDIDVPSIVSQKEDYKKTVALCERGKYAEAKPILKSLLEKNPTNSEYHRIMGQILSDEGQQDEAIDHLIDALRWDSKNNWALLMLGNIFAKFKNDIGTAMKYYDQALKVNPDDHITINNIGANLMQQGKLQEAKKYFWKAVEINDEYPNTHFALSMVAEMEDDLQSAFYSAVQAIKLSTRKNDLYKNAVTQLFEVSKRVIKADVGKKIYSKYLVKLEVEGGTDIDVFEDKTIPTAAKFELAENYNRTKHTIKYNPDKMAFEHLIMHELVHLDLIIEARKEDFNQLFVSTNPHKRLFIKKLAPTIKRLKREGYSEDSIANYTSGLFEGINRQIFNTPVDLFIESFLHEEFSELRPYQFLSMYAILGEGIQAVTDKKIVELSPPDILSKSKILNLVNAFQFKELFGIDLSDNFKANRLEMAQAEKFYKEFLEYKEDREPGEEYELVQHWAEDLNLDPYFELKGERQYRKSQNTDSFFESTEDEMFGGAEFDAHKERQMKKFQESQKELGTNMAVMWFMVDALQFFEGKDNEEVKKIAFEIAMQGTQGYRPDKKDYTLNSIPGKKFSGYHVLAFYYVSWAIAIPEMLAQLQLPYDEEYKQAKAFHQMNKK